MSRSKRPQNPAHTAVTWALLKARNGYQMTEHEKAIASRATQPEMLPPPRYERESRA